MLADAGIEKLGEQLDCVQCRAERLLQDNNPRDSKNAMQDPSTLA